MKPFQCLSSAKGYIKEGPMDKSILESVLNSGPILDSNNQHGNIKGSRNSHNNEHYLIFYYFPNLFDCGSHLLLLLCLKSERWLILIGFLSPFSFIHSRIIIKCF